LKSQKALILALFISLFGYIKSKGKKAAPLSLLLRLMDPAKGFYALNY